MDESAPIRDRIVEFTRVKASDLSPHPQNWREHPGNQRAAMLAIFDEIGYADALKVRKHNGGYQIIDGHLRAEATPDADIPVLVLDLDDDEAKKMLATFDPLGDLAEANEEMLQRLTDDLEFDSSELTQMMGDLLPGNVPEVEEDEVPEPPSDPITKAGDIIVLGNHRLMCGDATKEGDVARLMDGQKADLCFTSPPYAEQRNYGGCDLSVDYLSNFMVASSSFCKLFCVNLGIQRSEGEIVQYWDEYISKAKSIGLKLVGWLIWDRGCAKSVGQQTAMFPIEHEWIFAFAKKPFKLVPTIENETAGQKTNARIRGADGKLGPKRCVSSRDKRELGTVIRCQQVANNENHPAQFPTELPSAFIASVKGNVLDPFMGSGTTLIACEQLNRKCYGMEIDPAYCDVTIKRWENLTGDRKWVNEDRQERRRLS